MFLHPTRNTDFIEGDFIDLGYTYKKMRELQKQLKERFRMEYLSQLVQKGKTKGSKPPQVGDIVLIEMDHKKRFDWPTGRIVELIPGRDKKIRVARVQLPHDYEVVQVNNKLQVKKVKMGPLLTRALERLYPLEMQATDVPDVVKKIAIDQRDEAVVTKL